MLVVPIDQAKARAALQAATQQVAALVRSIPDPSLRIPNSEWTVGEAAAHMVLGARVYGECATGHESPVTDLGDLAGFNARFIREFPERQAEALAGLLVEAKGAFLTATAGRPGEEPMPWHEGHTLPVSLVTCIALGELLTHGYDIAKALGKPWPIKPQHARLIIAGMAPVLPRFVNEQAARGVRAGYELRIRGGPRFVCRFDDGKLTVEPPSARAVDCHISADPVAFLLVGYGRISQWRPILQGKMVAWGRKPWLAFKFKSLLRNP